VRSDRTGHVITGPVRPALLIGWIIGHFGGPSHEDDPIVFPGVGNVKEKQYINDLYKHISRKPCKDETYWKIKNDIDNGGYKVPGGGRTNSDLEEGIIEEIIGNYPPPVEVAPVPEPVAPIEVPIEFPIEVPIEFPIERPIIP
jgi:hypothetical protein